MLTFDVYYQDRWWWFSLVKVDPRKVGGPPIEVLYRRRYHTSDEAVRCGRQALEHERAKWAANVPVDENAY